LPFVQEIKDNQFSLLMKQLQGQVPEYLENKLRGLVMSPPEQPVTHCQRYNRETEGGRIFIAKAVKL